MFKSFLNQAQMAQPTTTYSSRFFSTTPQQRATRWFGATTTTTTTPTSKPTTQYSYIYNIQPQRHNTFRPTRAARDWHQHLDHKTREFYYENIFTGEKTKVQPKVFLPHDAPKESGAMAFLRSDRSAVVGVHKKKSILRPVFSVLIVAGTLFTLGEMGYLDKLFGYVPPPKRVVLSENVDLRAKDMLVRYEDLYRK